MAFKDPDKQRAYDAAYYLKNRDKIRARKIVYNEESREARAAWAATYYVKNKDEIATKNAVYRVENREELSTKNAAWRVGNPDKIQAARDRRTALEDAAAGGPFSKTRPDYLARVTEYGGKCAYCLKAKYKALDHAIPLSRGGTNHAYNIFPACGPCNNTKKDKILWDEWIPPKDFLEEGTQCVLPMLCFLLLFPPVSRSSSRSQPMSSRPSPPPASKSSS